ncbi:MAG: hypothetical protein H6727_09360 [Myxococcales bacterium]|nr:hypothetical protein [Myxococcales bacterium]
MSTQITQAHKGKRIKGRNAQSPSGVAVVEDLILRDTPFYQDKGTTKVGAGLALYKNQDRIGQSKQFLCNLDEAGKVPTGQDLEVRELSCYMNFRNAPPEGGATAGKALAEELYDLVMNCGYVKIMKGGKLTVAELPMRLIPQINGVTGSAGDAGAEKYTAGKGKLKLKEPIELLAGETFEVTFGFYEADNGAGYSPSTRFDAADEVVKNFSFHMHCVRVGEPVIG